MATVTGTLTDFGLADLDDYDPQIIFTASSAAVGVTRLLATRPIVVTPSSSGAFTVELAPTYDLRPAVWYTIRIQWRDPDGNFIGMDFLDWKLVVPGTGGALPDLLGLPVSIEPVWVSEDEPENPAPGMRWLNPLTGDLSEWSN